MVVYVRIWSDMIEWSYMWSFLCCSEVQLFRVPEVPSFPGFRGFQVSKVPLAQCRVNVGQFESVSSWGYVCQVEKVLVDQHCKCWSVLICLLPGNGSRWFLLNNTKSLLRPRPTLASQSGPNQAHIAMPGSPCRQIYTGVWLQRICSLNSTFIKAFCTNLNTVL
jgi:hypothetical protein